MSSQAYYLAQFAIIVVVAMVIASAAGAGVAGDSFSMGMMFGVVGFALIVTSLTWLWKHRGSRKGAARDSGA